jgi:hypothetical protein
MRDRSFSERFIHVMHSLIPRPALRGPLLLAAALSASLALTGCGRSQPPFAGFEYTRLTADGSIHAGGGPYATNPWACVRDERTGLVWEVKSDRPGLHAAANTYSWFFPGDEVYDRGDPGLEDAGACEGSRCDTQGYIDAVNASGLCGFDDWRLPIKEELMSLLDPRTTRPGPTVDLQFFPHTRAAEHWSSTTYAYHAPGAWTIAFDTGLDRVDNKTSTKHVILVRGTAGR